MANNSLSRQEWTALLRTQILPRVERQSAPLVLANPPALTSGVRIVAQVAPLLRSTQKGRNSMCAAHWVEEGFNAARHPTFIWVAEGEADFRIGVTRRMAALERSLSRRHGYYIASLPEGSFLMVPPGIPISDASRPHWERPFLSEARSRLLWFHFLPAGISLHSCATIGTQHSSTRALFLSEPRLLPLAETIVEELKNRNVHGETLARHYLAAALLHLERSLCDTRSPAEEAMLLPAQEHRFTAESTPLRHACQFIEARLSHKLSLAEIAAHAYISPTHLNRLFQAEMGVAAGEYLIQRRLEKARSLLETTDLPVQRVGVLCGYQHAAHFSRAFRQRHHLTPGEYRQKSRR